MYVRVRPAADYRVIDMLARGTFCPPYTGSTLPYRRIARGRNNPNKSNPKSNPKNSSDNHC